MRFHDRATRYLHSLLRFMSGLVFLQYGTSKILHFPKSGQSTTILMSTDGISGVIALVAGSLITVGLFTRSAALLASGLVAFGYFLVYAPLGFFPLLNGGNEPILMCFVFLFLAAAGGGEVSLDRVLFKT